MRPMTRQRLRLSGGTELSFITAGATSDPAVLLLHGTVNSARMFDAINHLHAMVSWQADSVQEHSFISAHMERVAFVIW